MEDSDIAARLRSGGWLVTCGILLLVGGFLGVCVAAASNADDPYATERSVEVGQSPWLLLSLGGGIALITVGQVKKSNARRDAEERFRQMHTTVEVVPDTDVPGGPFRGATKHVPVLDPVIQAVEDAARERDHRRGTSYLTIGGVIIVGTILMMLVVISGDSEPSYKKMENILMAFGLAVFPFGFGLFFAIKGLLLRSK